MVLLLVLFLRLEAPNYGVADGSEQSYEMLVASEGRECQPIIGGCGIEGNVVTIRRGDVVNDANKGICVLQHFVHLGRRYGQRRTARADKTAHSPRGPLAQGPQLRGQGVSRVFVIIVVIAVLMAVGDGWSIGNGEARDGGRVCRGWCCQGI